MDFGGRQEINVFRESTPEHGDQDNDSPANRGDTSPCMMKNPPLVETPNAPAENSMSSFLCVSPQSLNVET